MPPSKPLQTSTDSIPDKSITRSKLGLGAIVHIILSAAQGFSNSNTRVFYDINMSFSSDTESATQTPMPFSGIIEKIVLNIQSNDLATNQPIQFRKNGVNFGNPILVQSTDIGIKEYDLDLEFIEGDLLDITSIGDAATSFVCTTAIVIQFDG